MIPYPNIQSSVLLVYSLSTTIFVITRNLNHFNYRTLVHLSWPTGVSPSDERLTNNAQNVSIPTLSAMAKLPSLMKPNIRSNSPTDASPRFLKKVTSLSL